MNIQNPVFRPAVRFQGGNPTTWTREHLDKRVELENRIVGETANAIKDRLIGLGIQDPGVLPVGIPDTLGPHITIAYRSETEKNQVQTLIRQMENEQRLNGYNLSARYTPDEAKILKDELMAEWSAKEFRTFDAADDHTEALNARINGIEISMMDLPKALKEIEDSFSKK